MVECNLLLRKWATCLGYLDVEILWFNNRTLSNHQPPRPPPALVQILGSHLLASRKRTYP
ncbi:hypothetical protein OG21DRAFT_1004083 [Imleria badia]|nr:hypothetical protein OG21DRAFT_1004083 [Imleria badia]